MPVNVAYIYKSCPKPPPLHCEILLQKLRAEAVRFELTIPFGIPVFETGALDQLCDASNIEYRSTFEISQKMIGFSPRPYRLSVRTEAFQASKPGSTPGRVTN